MVDNTLDLVTEMLGKVLALNEIPTEEIGNWSSKYRTVT